MSTSDMPLYKDTLDNTTHSVWGYNIAAHLSLGLPISTPRNTTLNEKFNINANSKLRPNEQMRTAYYCIGNRGHRSVTTAFDISVNEPIQHDPTDAALYNHLPFVLRPYGDDLSEVERADYRLRRIEEFNGKRYIAYYAKAFTVDNRVKIVKTTTLNGVSSNDDYTATEKNLSPTPPAITPNRVERTANAKIHVSTGASINFTERDSEELLNVARIIYGDARLAIVSEIGVIMGVDETYTHPTDLVSYKELKAATISAFISTRRDIANNKDGFYEELWIGGKTPLLISSDLTPTVGR